MIVSSVHMHCRLCVFRKAWSPFWRSPCVSQYLDRASCLDFLQLWYFNSWVCVCWQASCRRPL